MEGLIFEEASATTSKTEPIRVDALEKFVLGENLPLRDEIFSYIENNPDVFKPFDFERSRHQHRADISVMLRYLAEHHIIRVRELRTNPIRYYSVLEFLHQFDSSLVIRAGVHWSLFGGSLLNLGTARHEKYLDKIDSLEMPGCFMMTELNHGSNVRQLETTSTYDKAAREFVIQTPSVSALKWWIGGAGTAKFATVFAQLIIDGQNLGVHAFLTQVRDDTGALMPGVYIGDAGEKVGLNGVDNGYIGFDQVRIPLENLLNRFGDVLPDGTYKSPLSSAARRFGAMLGELTGGRVGLAAGSTGTLKLSLTTAVRYASQRRQFGPSNDVPEIPILEYQTTQMKLVPLVSRCYAMDITKKFLFKKYAARNEASMAEVHVLSAGLKAFCSETTQRALHTLREGCGGHGYSAYNRFGLWRNDHDVFLTFEGDNTVLLQQLTKDLLTQYKAEFAAKKFTGPLRYFGRQLSVLIREKNIVATHRTDRTHLESHDFLQQTLEYRAARLLHTLALRLRSKVAAKGKKQFFAVWNECRMILAHIELMVFEHFSEGLREERVEPNRVVLGKMCSLVGLDFINADIGFFRNHHYIKHSKSKGMQRLFAALCVELKDNVTLLVDAFGVRDVCLGPMGRKGDFVNNTLAVVQSLPVNAHMRDLPIARL